MNDPARVARLLLEAAGPLMRASDGRAIMIHVDALPEEIESVPRRTILIGRDDADFERIERYSESAMGSVHVPAVTLNRLGQVKLGVIIALSSRLIDLGDTVVFLTGPYRALSDSLIVLTIGAEYDLFDSTDQPSIDEHIKRAVFHRCLAIALDLGHHGREGRKVGSLIVVGDAKHVLERSEQMILNPFKGYEDRERNILDDMMTETVREYSTLDGAFIVRGNGVIEAAGRRLKGGISEGLPSGLGSRHAAAAGITASTKSIAITISESDGTVRVWRAGRMVAAFEPS